MKLFSKILFAICGVLLVAAGVWCFKNPVITATTLTPMLLGIALTFTGISSFIGYFILSKDSSSTWILVQAIISTLLGIVVIFNPLASDIFLFTFFGIFIICSGAIKIVESIELKKLGIKIWYLPLALGILGVLLGMICFFNPFAAVLTMGIIIGLIFVTHGMSTISNCFINTEV